MFFIAIICLCSCAYALPRNLFDAKFSPLDLHVNGPKNLPDTHIINGEEATPGSLPWQGTLYRNYGGQFYFTCGCVLIDQNWVLTAAHCVDQSVDPAQYLVVLGDHDRTIVEGTEQEIYGAKVIQHPGWTGNGADGFPNDIALIALSQEANTSTSEISIVALPDSCDEKFSCDDDCVISGWGRTEDGSLPAALRKREIDVVKQKKCRDNWAQYGAAILDTHVCVGDGNEGSCNGDSGGPLVCEKNGRNVLAGVTSWGIAGCMSMPSVYTRVSSYIPWIFNSMH